MVVSVVNLLTNADTNRSSIELPQGTDFDTIIEGGRYNLNVLTSNSSPIPNYISSWVFVDIQRHSNPSFTFVTQLVYDFYNADTIYHRVGTGGDGFGNGTSWSNWASIGGLGYAAENVADKGAYNGYAPLINGKVPQANLPAGSVAISNVNVLNTQAEMLALLAAEGDIVIRTDTNESWIRNASARTATLTDWTMLSTPTNAVLSVAGKTGTVTLGPQDVSAEPSNPNIQQHISNISTNPHNVLTTQIGDFQTALLNGGYF